MTREQAKNLLPMIQAFAEGKKVEYKNVYGKWIEVNNPSFDEPTDYRIKPEPKYRPFKDKEECWAEMQKHSPLGWFKNKKADEFFALECISDKDPRIKTYEYLFKDCVFMDGSICGVKVEK